MTTGRINQVAFLKRPAGNPHGRKAATSTGRRPHEARERIIFIEAKRRAVDPPCTQGLPHPRERAPAARLNRRATPAEQEHGRRFEARPTTHPRGGRRWAGTVRIGTFLAYCHRDGYATQETDGGRVRNRPEPSKTEEAVGGTPSLPEQGSDAPSQAKRHSHALPYAVPSNTCPRAEPKRRPGRASRGISTERTHRRDNPVRRGNKTKPRTPARADPKAVMRALATDGRLAIPHVQRTRRHCDTPSSARLTLRPEAGRRCPLRSAPNQPAPARTRLTPHTHKTTRPDSSAPPTPHHPRLGHASSQRPPNALEGTGKARLGTSLARDHRIKGRLVVVGPSP